MKWYLSLIVLLVTINSYAVCHNLLKDDTKHDGGLSVENDQNITPTNITVETETNTNKTMISTLGQGSEVELAQGRTFGIQRLQFMLLPVMYKFGVMSTLLVALVLISLKSLAIGIILLFIKVGSFIASLKHVHHEAPPSPPTYLWPQPYHEPQPVHIYLHNNEDKHSSHDYHESLYDHHGQQGQYHVPTGWDVSEMTNPYERVSGINSHGHYIFKG